MDIFKKKTEDIFKKKTEDIVMKTILEWMKNHKLVTGIGAAVTCALAVFLVLLCVNQNYIEFSVTDNSVVEIEYGSDEQMEAVSALYKGTLFNKEGTAVEVSVEGQVEYDKVGSYELSYYAKHKDTTGNALVTVEIKDTQAPVITLVSDPEHYTSPVGAYEEEGFTAIDNYDGDITAQVVREEKEGVVTYTVMDSSGNETVVERNIIYKDVIAPVITLKGSENLSLYTGGNYSEAGYTATDECDGDITANVVVEGSVDTKKAGTYTVVYKVTDSSGNTAEAKRTVKVKSVTSGDKVIYLTFDDGPCAYTKKLLEVLDKYNVKVTFFVTGANPSYYYLIGDAYDRGHTIAVHTYSHKYSEIYASLDAYLTDFNKIRDIVVEQTGEEPWLVRFPGGTSNTVSRRYCTGVMTQISQEMTARGYTYCDWNVSSGDAGGATTEQQIINNVINGCANKKTSIVLQHDMNKLSVNAVEDIIQWGLANGYTFKAMSPGSPIVQQKPQN